MSNRKKFTGTTGRTLLDTRMEFTSAKSPSENKPNVIYVVLDDMGFAQLGCYGSTIHTPNIDRLAGEGVRFNNFHTTAICSATRCSLLTGMNHHSAGVSNLLEFTTGLHNAQGGIAPDCATIAEILKCYDYRTFAVGKWHLSKIQEMTDEGPFDNWPLQKGFDNFYGFLACQMNQWNPTLTRDNSMIRVPKKASEGYHLSEDLTDQAIRYIYHHELEHSEQPFFLYLAYGAMHAPHNAPKEYIDKYRGKFDQGWDKTRQEWFENQKKLGVIPDHAELTERNELIRAWDELSDKEQKAYARSMEVFAGYLEHTDAQIGRLLDYLEMIGQLDETMIVFLSDNGTSAEGGQSGTHNASMGFSIDNEDEAQVDRILRHYDDIGDEFSWPHYQMGWANCGNTPFQWYKTWVHNGGVKDPLIIRYPKVTSKPGSILPQYHHVSDITPTVLEILGFEKPEVIKGIHQRPLEGKSFLYAMEHPEEKERKHVQYYEMFGNRAIYKDGWKAVVNHAFSSDFKEDQWELYHVEEDFSEKYNVADHYPEKLEELKEEWLIEAAKYSVFPMFPKPFYKLTEEMTKNRHKMIVPEKVIRYEHVLFPHDIPEDPGLGSRTHSVTVELNRKSQSEEGVLISKGDRFAGISFYVKDNHLKYVYNLDGETYYTAVSNEELPQGKLNVKYEFQQKDGTCANVILYVNGKKVGETLVEHLYWATSYATSIKTNKYSSIYDKDYDAPYDYTGQIDSIEIDLPANEVNLEEEIKKGASID